MTIILSLLLLLLLSLLLLLFTFTASLVYRSFMYSTVSIAFLKRNGEYLGVYDDVDDFIDDDVDNDDSVMIMSMVMMVR